MKPHVTNYKHQKFSLLIKETIQKMEEIRDEEKIQLSEKITDLKRNKQALDEIYANYQLKLKELSNLLEDYEKTQQISKINLRIIQRGLKFAYTKLIKGFF